MSVGLNGSSASRFGRGVEQAYQIQAEARFCRGGWLFPKRVACFSRSGGYGDFQVAVRVPLPAPSGFPVVDRQAPKRSESGCGTSVGEAGLYEFFHTGLIGAT
jgi:hypothetical protein